MDDRQTIENVLLEIFNEANVIETDENNKLALCKEIDSIQLISIIVEIEERFNIEIPDEYLVADFLSDFNHVSDVVKDILNVVEKAHCN